MDGLTHDSGDIICNKMSYHGLYIPLILRKPVVVKAGSLVHFSLSGEGFFYRKVRMLWSTPGPE